MICAITPTDDPKDVAISMRKSEMIILGDETAKRERNSETMMRGLVSNVFSLRLVMKSWAVSTGY